jgi:hypothetical protein
MEREIQCFSCCHSRHHQFCSVASNEIKQEVRDSTQKRKKAQRIQKADWTDWGLLCRDWSESSMCITSEVSNAPTIDTTQCKRSKYTDVDSNYSQMLSASNVQRTTIPMTEERAKAIFTCEAETVLGRFEPLNRFFDEFYIN